MQSWQLVLVVLSAVLVGAAVPALLQLRSSLRRLERRAWVTGRKLDRTLDEIRVAANRVNRFTAGIEGGDRKLVKLLDELGSVTQMLTKMRGSLTIASTAGAALGPAVAAFVRTMARPDDERASVASTDEEADASAEPAGNGHERSNSNHQPVNEEERHEG